MSSAIVSPLGWLKTRFLSKRKSITHSQCANRQQGGITMAKTKNFYAVFVYDDERGGEIKAYCRTKEIAKRELKKYRDYFQDKPPKPDDRHIIKLEMIVE